MKKTLLSVIGHCSKIYKAFKTFLPLIFVSKATLVAPFPKASRSLQQQQTRLGCDHTIALSPSVNRQVFCVRDRLKMVQHQSLATLAFKSVGSMTMKGQMKPTCRVNYGVPGRREQPKQCPMFTIVLSILTNLIFRRNLRI